MRLLFLGDIVGRSGRRAVLDRMAEISDRLAPDIAVVNVENSAHGFGVTPAIAEELLAAGFACLTTGNHVWDQRELIGAIDSQPRLLRPMNFTGEVPGRGHAIIEDRAGRRVLVANAQARLFMESAEDPFAALDSLLDRHRLGREVAAVLVDFHGETTAEKLALGYHLDGRASLLVGTHTHIPTADARILPGGTAYLTDAGMCGDYDSVIGMEKTVAIQRFRRKLPTERLGPSSGPATICGVYVETDDATGLARHIAPLRLGPHLAECWPAPAATGA